MRLPAPLKPEESTPKNYFEFFRRVLDLDPRDRKAVSKAIALGAYNATKDRILKTRWSFIEHLLIHMGLGWLQRKKGSSHQPPTIPEAPHLALCMLSFLPLKVRDERIGDLEEMLVIWAKTGSIKAARRRYTRQAIKVFMVELWRSLWRFVEKSRSSQ